RLEEAEQLSEQDGAAGHRLREEQLGGAAIRGERQDADQERRQRNEEEHELDERGRRAREVLDAVPAREHVTRRGHGQAEDPEHGREDLCPARAHGEKELLPRDEEEGTGREGRRVGHGVPPSGSERPKTSAALSAVPPRAAGSASREAASAKASRCDPMGVSTAPTSA